MESKKKRRTPPARKPIYPAASTSDRTLRRLLVAAMAARARAYAPYSNFPVGAALLGDDGKVYAGCNVENSSYGLCICAERNAVAQAIARGAKGIVAAAVVGSSPAPTPPCGMCLQTLAEFAPPELPILLATAEGGEEAVRLGDLFPRRFDRSFLPDRRG